MKTYVGLDVSKKQTVAVWKNKKGEKVSEETFTTNKEGMDKLIKELGKNSEAAVEASTSGVFVHNYLADRNINIVMSNPHKVRLIAESEKKTDRNDAEILADLLRTNMLPACYIPPKEVREIRDIVRHRRALVETNTVIRNKIRAILTRDGICFPYDDILAKKSLKWLDNVEINKIQKTAISKFVWTALMIEEEIKEYDTEIYSEYKSNKEAQLLDTIPGISYYSAVHIMSVIGDIKRFPSARSFIFCIFSFDTHEKSIETDNDNGRFR